MPAVLIGLTGRAGVGKSTAAEYLHKSHGFTRERFAGPLKDMLRAIGLTDRELEGDLKEKTCALLGGQTPRFAMQRLGSEWGRDLIHPELWTMILQERAKALLAGGHSVCVEDCRFPNEVAAIKALGGHIIRIRTFDINGAFDDHPSETQNLPFDASIFNEGLNVEVLHARIDGALEHLGG